MTPWDRLLLALFRVFSVRAGERAVGPDVLSSWSGGESE